MATIQWLLLAIKLIGNEIFSCFSFLYYSQQRDTWQLKLTFVVHRSVDKHSRGQLKMFDCTKFIELSWKNWHLKLVLNCEFLCQRDDVKIQKIILSSPDESVQIGKKRQLSCILENRRSHFPLKTSVFFQIQKKNRKFT